MNPTVEQAIASLKKLIKRLEKEPDGSIVQSFVTDNPILKKIDITNWYIGDVTENSIDILF